MSNTPISIDLPHELGAEEAKRRIGGNIHRLKDHIPSAAEVRANWEGDRLALAVLAMGQQVEARIDVHERFVRVEAMLPPALGFFGKVIEAGLRRGGRALLEDRSKG